MAKTIRHCIDCGAPISREAKRCRACSYLWRGTDPGRLAHLDRIRPLSIAVMKKSPHRCTDCGILISHKAKRCRPCFYIARSNNPEWYQKLKESAPNRKKVPKEIRSELSKAAWARGAYDGAETLAKRQEASRRVWQNPERRRKGAEHMRQRWADPVYREKMTKMSQGMWTDELRKYYAQMYTGEGNPNWNGGSSFEPYPVEFNGELKTLIRDRDGHKCAICGRMKEAEEEAFDVHHIDYDKENNAPENLITICHTCHPTTNGDRDFWRALLSSKWKGSG